MHKKQILSSLAAVVGLASMLILWVLPDFGVDFPLSSTAIIIIIVLFIVSVAYLAFVEYTQESGAHKKRMRQFERIGLVSIIPSLIVYSFWPRVAFLLWLLFIMVLYWFFFWRRAKQ